MLEANGNHQKTAQETVKYEVRGGPLDHQCFKKARTSGGLTS